MLVSCDWWFSIRIFFVAEKPSPKMPTCSVINFHNLLSLLGLFGSLVSEQTESSDWCWFVVQNSFFRGIKRENWRFLVAGKSQLVVSYQVMTDPCCGLSVIFCGFISHLIGRETINIPEIFSGVHGFTGKTVIQLRLLYLLKKDCLLGCIGKHNLLRQLQYWPTGHIMNWKIIKTA